MFSVLYLEEGTRRGRVKAITRKLFIVQQLEGRNHWFKYSGF